MTAQIRALDELDGKPHANPFPNSESKTIRLTLDAGEAVPPHAHPGRQIVCYLVEGELELTLGDVSHQLAAGDIARFDGDQQISPEVIEDSTAVPVLAPATDTDN